MIFLEVLDVCWSQLTLFPTSWRSRREQHISHSTSFLFCSHDPIALRVGPRDLTPSLQPQQQSKECQCLDGTVCCVFNPHGRGRSYLSAAVICLLKVPCLAVKVTAAKVYWALLNMMGICVSSVTYSSSSSPSSSIRTSWIVSMEFVQEVDTCRCATHRNLGQLDRILAVPCNTVTIRGVSKTLMKWIDPVLWHRARGYVFTKPLHEHSTQRCVRTVMKEEPLIYG